MGEFFVRVATPADADRLWVLFDEAEQRRFSLPGRLSLKRAERRRADLVTHLLDFERPILIAYAGLRAVGFLELPAGVPYVSESWRGLGVENDILEFLK